MTPNFDDMLTECAKFNISVNLSHHNHLQITSKTLNTILGTCHTKAVFACGYDEAVKMSRVYQIEKEKMAKIPKYYAYIQIGNDVMFVKTVKPPDVPPYTPPPPRTEAEGVIKDDMKTEGLKDITLRESIMPQNKPETPTPKEAVITMEPPALSESLQNKPNKSGPLQTLRHGWIPC